MAGHAVLAQERRDSVRVGDGRALDAECLANELRVVGQDREVDAELGRLADQVVAPVLPVDVEQQELDAA